MPKRKGMSKASGKRGHGGRYRVSTEEAASDRLRIKIAEALFDLAWEPALDHKGKLYALKMALRNLRPALDELRRRATDQALATSDVVFCLLDMIMQLLATLAYLLGPEPEAPTPASPVGGSNKSLRARRR